LAKWQECSINDNNAGQLLQQGLDCLAQIAAHPSVVTLASKLVINVIVSSSPHKPYCAGAQDVTCNHTIWGFVQADGPWFNAGTAEPDYQEGDSTKNWVWLRFTEFDVGSKNNANSWDAGGNTFAHEVCEMRPAVYSAVRALNCCQQPASALVVMSVLYLYCDAVPQQSCLYASMCSEHLK
jgi:hypothetical protein